MGHCGVLCFLFCCLFGLGLLASLFCLFLCFVYWFVCCFVCGVLFVFNLMGFGGLVLSCKGIHIKLFSF